MTMKFLSRMSWAALARWFAAGAMMCLSASSFGGTADIGNVPPPTMSSSNVRPNLLFILDNSGSMASDFVPDDVGNDDGYLCFGYSGHNGVFFNPSLTYSPPALAGGGNYANASFSGAKSDGYVASSSTLDLSQPLNLPHTYTTSQSDNCTKNASGCSNSSSTTSDGKEINVSVSCSKRSSTCSRTTTVVQHYYYATLNAGATDNCTDANYSAVISLPLTQRQNYANWYQYYRTRMLMMRSASGLVFANLDPTRYRIGFTTISYTGTSDGSSFLNVNDFDKDYGGGVTQKSKFYSVLYGQTPSGSTPLRPSLVKAGQYFAKKVSNQSYDPMQYSCQRNYTLLSTDGYWNTGSEPGQPYYVPKRLDGTAIGDVDGASGVVRPMYDASHAKNSLSDIAKYWYDTDLRTSDLGNCTSSTTGADVCQNRTPKPGDTSPVYQNMSTFTLGLGVPGVLNYQSNYASATSGDYADIVSGAKNWPDPLSSSSSGYANTGNTVTSRIDDLWHAAVNAGGTYYSARDPAALTAGLTDALQRIDAQAGASAAAATSTLEPTGGVDQLFVPSYETKTWVGNISAYHYGTDPQTGAATIGGLMWQASSTLSLQTSRRIVMFDSTASNKLKDFTYSNLSTSQQAYFNGLCASGNYKLNQCATLTSNALAQVTGANVVNYLRGSNQYELWQPVQDNQVFRSRKGANGQWTPLGDIVDSRPTFVGKPPFSYQDNGYSDFQANNTSREQVLYVGANDGMLHAIRASDGYEEWAYVPTQLIPNLYHLADESYSTSHRFYVDSSPVMGDVYDGTRWRTILVGGLGAGGTGYYALDVTDPIHPVALWEFTDNDMGLTFGRPVIGKNQAGQWIVAFTSGYNNTSGDGNGHLYVLSAITGTQISKLNTYVSPNTPAGTSGSPSNLGQIQPWVDDERDNTMQLIYGADMQGNVWRFDFDGRLSGPATLLLGTAKGPTGAAQPITVTPMLSGIKNQSTFHVVSVATGRYLGISDLSDTNVQSVYTFKDALGSTGLGNFRADANMVRQVLNSSHQISSPASVDWTTQHGWYMDFDQSVGERVDVDMALQVGVLTVATTVPQPTPCSPGGTSWLYNLNADSGSAYTSTTASNVLIVGVTDITETGHDQAGTEERGLSSLIVRSDGSVDMSPVVGLQSGPAGTPIAYRSSWRELVN
jgi:type IV pilus assembly protein PilY1